MMTLTLKSAKLFQVCNNEIEAHNKLIHPIANRRAEHAIVNG